MDEFVGLIMPFGQSWPPNGWKMCQGQPMPISTYQALYALIGTTYGGDGIQTFNLPDLRGRVPIGQGQGIGTSNYVMGQFAGHEAVTLLTSNLPTHTHVATFTGTGSGGGGTPVQITSSLKASALRATQNIPGAGTPAATCLAAPYDNDSGTTVLEYVNDPNPGVTLSGLTVTLNSGGGGITGGTVVNTSTGNSQPLSVLSPYLAVNYCIAIEGIFPSRN